MNLAEFSIENNRITFFVLGGIVVMGLALYQSLARDSMPPYTIRVASVVTQFPGASPERVEELVTDKIEKAAQELPGRSCVPDTHHRLVAAMRADERQDRLADRERQRQDQRELPDLRMGAR